MTSAHSTRPKTIPQLVPVSHFDVVSRSVPLLCCHTPLLLLLCAFHSDFVYLKSVSVNIHCTSYSFDLRSTFSSFSASLVLACYCLVSPSPFPLSRSAQTSVEGVLQIVLLQPLSPFNLLSN